MSNNYATTPLQRKRLESVNSQPVGLQAFIDLANQLPPDFDLPSDSLDVTEWLRLASDDPDKFRRFQTADSDAWRQLVERQKRQRVSGRRKYAGIRRDQLWVPNMQAKSVRTTLRRIVAQRSRAAQETKRVEIDNFGFGLDQIEITRDGLARVVRSDRYRDFLHALEGTDVSRIRECPLCKRLFWATRRDKQVCSPSCRVKKRRSKPDWENKRAEYEARRASKERR